MNKRFSRTAFTLIELLVVVAIIALLIAILLPSLGKAKEMTSRTVCATGLKGQGTSFALYAASYNDRLPSIAGGNWLHDEASANLDLMVGMTMNNGASMDNAKKMWFCPSQPNVDITTAWTTFGGTNGYRALTYILFNARGSSVTLPPRTSGKMPPISWHKKMSEPDGSITELSADEIISTTGGNSPIGFDTPNPGSNFHEITNHMGDGSMPSGQNVLSLDTHVSWRAWSGGGSNATPISMASNAYLWVIDP